jgi:hypothetical protein
VHQVGFYYANKLFMFVLKETISEHRETFSPHCTRDLIDSFLQEMELRKKETDSTFNGETNKIYLLDFRRVLRLESVTCMCTTSLDTTRPSTIFYRLLLN